MTGVPADPGGPQDAPVPGVGAGPPAGAADPSQLDRAIAELDRSAERLRAGGLDADEAAALVERCAELATDVARALEREARVARQAPPPGQEQLL